MTATTPSTPKSWPASDAEVVSWTIQAFLASRDRPDLSADLLLSGAEDLNVFLAGAAAQVSERHDVVRGHAEHLVTSLSVWPCPGDPGLARLLVDIGGPPGGPLLASRPIPLHALVPRRPCDPEVTITIALTHAFARARDLIRHHSRLRIDPVLASRIARWCDRYRDERDAHEAAVDQDTEPLPLLDAEITGCELLLDVGSRLDQQAIGCPGPAEHGRRQAA